MAAIDKMTPEQKRRYDQLQLRIQKLAAQQKLLVHRASAQERKDATRRAIVTGQLLFAKAAKDDKTRMALDHLLRNGVAENMQYLFPEIWPDAQRPTRKRQAQEENEETNSPTVTTD
jgi:hypothetical protein